MKIHEAKRLLRVRPMVFLRNPWLLLYIPIIGFIVFINRIKPNEDKVIFLETNVDEFLNFNRKIIESELDNYELYTINTFDDFNIYLKDRLNEDTEASIRYEYLVRKLFSKNAQAFVLIKNHEPLGYMFAEKEKTTIPQVNLTLKMPNNTITTSDLYIFKKYRGKGFYRILYVATINYLKNRGASFFWCWVMEENVISIKAHIKMGIYQVNKIITRKSRMFLTKLSIENINMNLSELINFRR